MLIHNLIISSPTQADLKSAYQVFDASIPEAFEKEGLGHLQEDIAREIEHKKHMLDESMNLTTDIYFLMAKLDQTVVGTISYGPCGEEIKKCTNNQLVNIGELGSLFVLPHYQGQGIGSELIHAMVASLSERKIDQFCLDSGYGHAQKRWLRKFGEPFKVAKDFWGPNLDHMIWLCKVIDFTQQHAVEKE